MFKSLFSSLFQALCQWGRLKRAGDERGRPDRAKGEVKRASLPPSPFLSRIPLTTNPACLPLAFSIVLTDREPGTGYYSLNYPYIKRLKS